MLDNIGLILAYSGVGLALLIAGFYVLDLLTPGKLGARVINGNINAAVLMGTLFVTQGIVLWFAIFFTGAGWKHLDDAAVYGAVGLGAQIAGFLVLDVLTPGNLGKLCMPEWTAVELVDNQTEKVMGVREHHAPLQRVTLAAAGLLFAMGLIAAASLT